MKSIAILVSADRPTALECANEILRMAGAAGIGVAFVDDAPGLASTRGATPDGAELVITIGGDGTLLRGCRLAVPLDVPIIGLNTGRLGFLTEIETTVEGMARMGRVLDGDFAVERRLALQASVNGSGAHFALNDVVVRRGAAARMAPFGLSLDGEVIAHISSDGIVVATPTGSTAYFLSAGGPIIAPSVDAFGVTALLPHTLFARPLIVPTSSKIEITCDSEIVHTNLEADGTFVSDLSSGDLVTVVRAPRPVKFARTGDQEVLRPARRQAAMGRSDQTRMTSPSLLRLRIDNVGLIAHAQVEFGEAFTAFTGETGSGKTMLLGALDAALGGRVERELIRGDRLRVALEIGAGDDVRALLATMGIELAADDDVVVVREVTAAGRSQARINGVAVSASQLRALGSHVVDAVGQGEAHRLLEPGFARDLLDRFAGELVLALRERLRERYETRAALRAERDALAEGGDRALAEREFARFALGEIEAAALEAGEDDRLRERRDVLGSAERIADALTRARGAGRRTRCGRCVG